MNNNMDEIFDNVKLPEFNNELINTEKSHLSDISISSLYKC